MNEMTRIGIVLVAFAGILLPLAASNAQTPAPPEQFDPVLTDAPASRPQRPMKRVPIYPRREEGGVYPRDNPGPNAVRECTATYVQENRPSGPVITPHMNCFWRRG